MRRYVLVTGIVFALILLGHVARVLAEGLATLRDPLFAASTLVAVGLCSWAWRLWRASRPDADDDAAPPPTAE